MKNLVLVILMISLSACATTRGFDRSSLRGHMTEEKVVSDADIANALNLKPQLPNPFKLAIYFSHNDSWSTYRNDWNWLGVDKDALLEIEKELVSKNIVSDVFVISDSIVSGQDTRSIRLAAAKAGADAVIVVNGVSDIDRYNNFLGVTYVLLVTPLFIPGTVVDALFMTNATMWDVRNEYLYLSIDAEGMAKEVSPAFFIEESRVIKQAKATAVKTLKQELLTRLSEVDIK